MTQKRHAPVSATGCPDVDEVWQERRAAVIAGKVGPAVLVLGYRTKAEVLCRCAPKSAHAVRSVSAGATAAHSAHESQLNIAAQRCKPINVSTNSHVLARRLRLQTVRKLPVTPLLATSNAPALRS